MNNKPSTDQFNSAMFDALYEGVSEAIFFLEENGLIAYANPAALDWLGLNFQEIHGKELSIRGKPDKQTFGYFDLETLYFEPKTFNLAENAKNGRWVEAYFSTIRADKEYTVLTLKDNENGSDDRFIKASYQIAELVNQTSDIAAFYEALHSLISRYIHANNFYVALFDADAEYIRFPYYKDEQDYLDPEAVLVHARNRKQKRGLTEYLIHKEESVLLSEKDIQALSAAGEIDVFGSLPSYWMGAPIKTVGGRLLGVLVVQSYTEKQSLTQKDKTLLTFAASQMALKLELSQFEEQHQIERHLFTSGRVVVFKQLLEDQKFIKNLYVSPSVRQFGYEPRAFLQGDLTYQSIIHPEDQGIVFDYEALAFQNDQAHFGSEYRILTADGDVRWVYDYTHVYKWEDESFLEFNFYILDITEQKEAEAKLKVLNEELEQRVEERTSELKETQTFLQKIMETIPVPVFYINQKGQYIGVNEAYKKLTGLSSTEIIGKTALDVWPGEQAQRYHTSDLALIKKGGKDAYEVQVTSKTGQVMDTIIYKAVFTNQKDSSPVLVGILLDITQRKRAEFKQSVLYMISEAAGGTEDLDTLFKTVHQIIDQLMPAKNLYIALYDSETELVSFSYHVDEHFPVAPQPRKNAFGLTEMVINKNETLFLSKEEIIEIAKGSGHEPHKNTPHQWLGVPLKSKPEKVIGALVVQTYDQADYIYTKEDREMLEFVSRQIAVAIERKQIQEELRLLNKELEIKVANRTQQINAQLVDLKQRERELTAVVDFAQEIRTVSDIPAIHTAVIKYTQETLQPDGLATALIDEERHELYFVSAEGVFKDLKDRRLSLQVGATGWAARTGQVYLNNDLQNNPGPTILNMVFGVNALLIVPMIAEDKVIGLLGVGSDRAWVDEDERILKAIAEIAANAIQRERLNQHKEHQLTRLNTLREIDRMITGNVDLYNGMVFLLGQIVQQLHVDAADLLLTVEGSTFLKYGYGTGFKQPLERESLISFKQGPAEWAMVSSDVVFIPNVNESSQWKDYFDGLPFEKFVSYFAVPLKTKGQVLGVLEIFNRSPLEVKEDWQSFLFDLSQQTAIAIENAQLIDKLQLANRDMLFAYDKTIAGWARALELRDHETAGHSMEVMELTIKLAQMMGIRRAEELTHIRRGALLHDIGKMGIPDNILLKPGKLTDDEWVIMRKHPEYARDLLFPIEFLRPALDIPYYHHERWDGSGYPRGLKGQDIPFSARIFAVIDVFNALTNDRPYSKAWPVDEALKFIQENKGILFDPEVVTQFIRLAASTGFLD